MNWLKQNPIAVVLIVVALIGTGATSYLAVDATTRRDEAQANLDAQLQKLKQFQNQKPFPTEQSLKAIKDSLEEYRSELGKYRTALAAMEKPLSPINPQEFQDDLRKAVDELRKKAIEKGVTLPDNFFYGFDEYQATPPSQQEVGELNREFSIMRRIADGLNADVASVASVFISRWDAAVVGRVPAELTGKLALAVGESVHHAYVHMLNDTTQQTIATSGGRPQRLLFASTSTKDPSASDTLYVEGLIAPNTINTMPDATLQAFADHGRVGRILDGSGGSSQTVLAAFAEQGIDVPELGVELQEQGAQAFVTAWQDLMQVLARS
jgi:type II secretory pathway pseudopilin PulG